MEAPKLPAFDPLSQSDITVGIQRGLQRMNPHKPGQIPTSVLNITSLSLSLYTVAIPLTQRACVLPRVRSDVQFVSDHPVVPPSQLLPGQCLVKLTHSGVCHTDLAIKQGETPIVPKPDLIGGHEGIGSVVAIGLHTLHSPVKIGDRVGIKLAATTCLSCEMCLKGYEGHCENTTRCGVAVDGTFCEYAVAYTDYVTPIPDGLDSAEAAAIMCAGITVYSALLQSGTHVGDWIVIPGAGGGLGHLAIQYAVAMGLRVIAIDSGEDKRRLCLELGSERWIDFRETTDIAADIISITEGGAHAALVTAGGSSAYDIAATYLRPKGYLMVVGLPPNAMLSIPILLVAAKGLTIRGIFLGNRQEAIEAVKLAAAGKVRCRFTLRGLSELNQVYDEMEKGGIVGRVVLDIGR